MIKHNITQQIIIHKWNSWSKLILDMKWKSASSSNRIRFPYIQNEFSPSLNISDIFSYQNTISLLTFSQWPNFLTSSKEFWHESWHLDHRVLHYSALSSNGFHWNWAQKIMNVKKLWFILQLVSNEIYLHTKMTFENGFTSLLSDPIRNINMVSFPSVGYTLLIFSWSLPLLHTRLPVTDHIIINL